MGGPACGHQMCPPNRDLAVSAIYKCRCSWGGCGALAERSRRPAAAIQGGTGPDAIMLSASGARGPWYELRRGQHGALQNAGVGRCLVRGNVGDVRLPLLNRRRRETTQWHTILSK